MTTQAYLSQAKRFDRMTMNKVQEIERYKELLLSTTVAPKQDVIQSSGNKDKLGTFMAKIVDLEKELDYVNMSREKIIKQIEGMSDPDVYQVLYSKYISDCSLNEIARLIHISKTHVYRLHDRALVEFEEKYGKYYLDIQ